MQRSIMRVMTMPGLRASFAITQSSVSPLGKMMPTITPVRFTPVRFSSKISAGAGARQGGKGARGKSRGFKKSNLQFCRANDIIVTQIGSKFHPGLNAHRGRDHTVHASCDGWLKFSYTFRKNRIHKRWRKFVSIEPLGSAGTEVETWHTSQTANYYEILKRKQQERKGTHFYERIPQMLIRTAKEKLVAQGKPPVLEGDWKAILRTIPRTEARMERIREQLSHPHRHGEYAGIQDYRF